MIHSITNSYIVCQKKLNSSYSQKSNMQDFVKSFNSCQDEREQSNIFTAMLRHSLSSAINVDYLLYKQSDGEIIAGIAALTTKPFLTKDRFLRLIELIKIPSYFIAAKCMELLHKLLITNILDDYEKHILCNAAMRATDISDNFSKIRYGWIVAVMKESAVILRENVTAGIFGAFVGNCIANNGICDYHIRGIKHLMDRIIASNGTININDYYESMNQYKYLFGAPHPMLITCFFAFTHFKLSREKLINLVTLFTKDNYHEDNIIIMKAILYAIKTCKIPLQPYHFIEDIYTDIDIMKYLQLKDETSKHPLAVAINAFCQSPNDFLQCIELCKNSDDYYVSATIAAMLVGCRIGTKPHIYPYIIWNGNNITQQIISAAETIFVLANNDKILYVQ